MYVTLTGKLPLNLDYDSPDRFVEGLLTQEPNPPSSHVSSLKDIDLIALKCLKKHPNDRYSSASELRNEISKVLGFSSKVASTEDIVPEIVPPTLDEHPDREVYEGNQDTAGEEARKMISDGNKEKEKQDINISIKVAAGDNNRLEPRGGSTDGSTGKVDPQVTRSLSYAVDNLRTLYRSKNYNTVLGWLTDNFEYLKEKKPNCIKHLENELLPNLTAVVHFNLDPTQVNSKIESFISCLER